MFSGVISPEFLGVNPSSLEPPSAPTQIPSSMLAFAPTQFAEPMASIVHDQPDLPLAPPPIPTASFNPCTNAVYNPGPSTGVSAEAAPVLNYPQNMTFEDCGKTALRPDSSFYLKVVLHQTKWDRWRSLELPADDLSQLGEERRGDDTVYLSVAVQSSSRPGEDIQLCGGCRERVHKGSKGKGKSDGPVHDGTANDIPTPTNEEHLTERAVEPACIIVFTGSKRRREFKNGSLELRFRVPCSSSHHNEPKGYRLLFTIKDSAENVIGHWTKPTILIIDRREKNCVSGSPQGEDTTLGIGPIRRRTQLSHRESTTSRPSPYPVPRLRERGSLLEGHGVACPPTLSGARLQQPYNIEANASVIAELPGLSSVYSFPEQQLTDGLCYSTNTGPSLLSDPIPAPVPNISDVIPSSGPITGQVKISVLGTGFPRGHRTVFGDAVAETTWRGDACWSILPPRDTPGEVEVRFDGVPVMGTTQRFTYVDDRTGESERQFLKLLGWMYMGGEEDTKTIARTVMATFSGSQLSAQSRDTRPQGFARGSTVNVETVFLGVLALLDKTWPRSSISVAEAVALAANAGQTLLHLSASLGFERFSRELLLRGVDSKQRDANGFTPLHFAALFGKVDCARLLISEGADPTIVDIWGRVPKQVALDAGHNDAAEVFEAHEAATPNTDESSSHHVIPKSQEAETVGSKCVGRPGQPGATNVDETVPAISGITPQPIQPWAAETCLNSDDAKAALCTRHEEFIQSGADIRENRSNGTARASFKVAQWPPGLESVLVRFVQNVMGWMDTEGPSSILFVRGTAGIGKTAISKALAEHIGSHGASFFFSSDDNNRKTATSLFHTLATGLLRYSDNNNNARVEDFRLQDQLHFLIAALLRSTTERDTPIVIVIDALDQCDERDAALILNLLAWEVPRIPRLRVFITGRPERHIEIALRHCVKHKHFQMHDLEDSIVETDVKLYITFRLSAQQVLKAFPNLQPTPWQPTREETNGLARMSGKRLHIASALTDFILDQQEAAPAKRTSSLLAHDSFGNRDVGTTDGLYARILRTLWSPADDWIGKYQNFVGTIVLLRSPLPCEEIADLLDTDRSEVLRMLAKSRSLFHLDRNGLRTRYASFVDFISSPDRCVICPEFYIDPTKHHLRVAKSCLRIMNRRLRVNLCDLSRCDWHKDRAQIIHIIQNRVSPHLAYACSYWAYHLVGGLGSRANLDDDMESLLWKFASGHLFSWLEAVSIIGRVDTAYTSLHMAYKIMVNADSSNRVDTIQELFYDGGRFIQRNIETLRLSIMHYSALPFAPQGTLLYRTYNEVSTSTLKIISGFGWTWGPLVAVLRGHTDSVEFVTFSSGGSMLASASRDGTVQLWDAKTGAHVATLSGHSGAAHSVVFSPDGLTLASASFDKTVRIWDTNTGSHINTLEAHGSAIKSVAFSPDGLRFVSASEDKTPKLWDGKMGTHIATLEGHRGSVNSVIFSPNGAIFASVSAGGTIGLWDGKMGAHISSISHRCHSVNVVAFSPDGSRLASGSWDGSIRIWEAKTGAHIATLEGHHHSVNVVAFSVDGSRIASGSSDGTVRLWNGQTGDDIAVLVGHAGSVSNVVFSPDGSILGSASWDETVQLWGAKAGEHITKFEGHTDRVISLAFSSDGSRIASASLDNTVRLWDCTTHIHTTALARRQNSAHSVGPPSPRPGPTRAPDGKVIPPWSHTRGTHGVDLGNNTNAIHSVTTPGDLTITSSDAEMHETETCNDFISSDSVTRPFHIVADGPEPASDPDHKTASPSGASHKSSVSMQPSDTTGLRFVLKKRTEPTMYGLEAHEIGEDGSISTSPLCWFPSDLAPKTLSTDATGSLISLCCEDGRVYHLDVSDISSP